MTFDVRCPICKEKAIVDTEKNGASYVYHDNCNKIFCATVWLKDGGAYIILSIPVDEDEDEDEDW